MQRPSFRRPSLGNVLFVVLAVLALLGILAILVFAITHPNGLFSLAMLGRTGV